jgi:hypothetical protein
MVLTKPDGTRLSFDAMDVCFVNEQPVGGTVVTVMVVDEATELQVSESFDEVLHRHSEAQSNIDKSDDDDEPWKGHEDDAGF